MDVIPNVLKINSYKEVMIMKKTIAFSIVFLLLTFIAYLETPTAKINEEYVYYYSETETSEEASTTEEDEIYGAPTLEFKLEETSEEDGYIVEEYREYEIYKNRDGEVIKTVPTSNTEYLKYYESD